MAGGSQKTAGVQQVLVDRLNFLRGMQSYMVGKVFVGAAILLVVGNVQKDGVKVLLAVLHPMQDLIPETEYPRPALHCGFHILLPYEEYTYILNTPVSSLATKSIFDYIMENNIATKNGGDLFIGATRWCKGAGTSGTDRMVVYVNHERFLKADELVPLSRIMSAPNVANVCYDTAYMANLSELQVMYPQTITYWDHIGGDT